jgi:predicted amidohydrolase/ribosomal protein S18 acetylase RimI-like enzyme
MARGCCFSAIYFVFVFSLPESILGKTFSVEYHLMKIDTATFEKKIKVRPITIADFDRLVQLQLKCFPGMTPWKIEQVESQMEIFPEGQLCVEHEGKIVASSSSLVLDFAMYDEYHSWREIADQGYIRNHNPRGNTLYGIEIMVDPKYRGLRLARRLYDARKKLARKMNLMRIVLGGRIPGYIKYKGKMTARQYVEKVVSKELVDPVLTAQLSNGFVLKRLIDDYMTSDAESSGYATLLEWNNIDYQPDIHKKFIATRVVRICTVQYQMREINSFEAADYKADFILFPEIITMQLLSFTPAERPGLAVRKLAEFTPQYLEFFCKMAIKYDINIIGGSHFSLEEGHLYNVSYLFKRDGSIGKQYKLHVTPNERRWWGVEPGNTVEVFDTDKGKINIQICYDIEFPELSRIAVEKGAQIIFVPFSTDERTAYLRVRYCAQARCIENHVFVAMAGTVGNLPSVENMDIQYAQSGIYTPSDIPFSRDAIASESTPNIETIIIDDVDTELLKRHRQSGSVLNWMDRRTDLYDVRMKKKNRPSEPPPDKQ